MSRLRKVPLAYKFAHMIMEQREVIDGITTIHGERLMTTAELCEVGRLALDLIEEGKVR